MHIDKLPYGWWEKKRNQEPLPTTIQHANNFVLHAQDLEEYDAALLELKERVDAEWQQVRFSREVLRNGHLPKWDNRTPTLYTIAHVMEFFIKMAKSKLRLITILHDLAERRTDVNNTNS